MDVRHANDCLGDSVFVGVPLLLHQGAAELERDALQRGEDARQRLADLLGNPPLRIAIDGALVRLNQYLERGTGGLWADVWVAIENSDSVNCVMRSLSFAVVDTRTGVSVWSGEAKLGKLVRTNSTQRSSWVPKNQNIPGHHCITASVIVSGSIAGEVADSLGGQHVFEVSMQAMGQEKYCAA